MSQRRSARNKKNANAVETENELQLEEPPKKKTRTKQQKPVPENEREINTEVEEEAWKNASSIYEFTAKDINGEEVSLEKYKGHVCIIVNVASRCGHTASNYEQFNKLHTLYADEKGLRILAFPCNQFASQEPGDNKKICEFKKKKNVEFDVFEKIDVNGKKAHPLWKFLKDKIDGPKGPNINWNFTKFIIDKEGKVVERFKPTVKPLQLVEHLEKYW
ncbi:probable phospholipid hydroperoxide glutathione peroxidase [Anoplophora glabripennis]|uniref:probable phospholipid hydroperoxide glutathione peroxidase n=1 Tax=Anoplophora glabripennis TaxID=217634 RepID=UPI000874207A|nr:probable phospholipid hydroperoxide glutathione peroxidase [Anoplophora glabripennis]